MRRGLFRRPPQPQQRRPFWYTQPESPDKTGFDSGVGTETASVLAAIPASDSGTGTESASVVAAVPATDSGTGTDTAARIDIARSESGAGTDAAAVAAAIPASDSGVGSDTKQSIEVRSATGDSGVGTESATVQVAISASAESGTGTDTATGIGVAAIESGAGTDTAAVAAAVPASESGAGTDAAASVGLVASDSGVGTESAVVSVSITASDSGVGTDTASVHAEISASDSGVGTESGSKEEQGAQYDPTTFPHPRDEQQDRSTWPVWYAPELEPGTQTILPPVVDRYYLTDSPASPLKYQSGGDANVRALHERAPAFLTADTSSSTYAIKQTATGLAYAWWVGPFLAPADDTALKQTLMYAHLWASEDAAMGGDYLDVRVGYSFTGSELGTVGPHVWSQPGRLLNVGGRKVYEFVFRLGDGLSDQQGMAGAYFYIHFQVEIPTNAGTTIRFALGAQTEGADGDAWVGFSTVLPPAPLTAETQQPDLNVVEARHNLGTRWIDPSMWTESNVHKYIPQAPTNVVIKGTPDGRVTITWTDPPGLSGQDIVEVFRGTLDGLTRDSPDYWYSQGDHGAYRDGYVNDGVEKYAFWWNEPSNPYETYFRVVAAHWDAGSSTTIRGEPSLVITEVAWDPTSVAYQPDLSLQEAGTTYPHWYDPGPDAESRYPRRAYDAPTNVVVEWDTPSGRPHITWTDPGGMTGADFLLLYESSNPDMSPYQNLGRWDYYQSAAPGDQSTYGSTGLQPGGARYYRIVPYWNDWSDGGAGAPTEIVQYLRPGGWTEARGAAAAQPDTSLQEAQTTYPRWYDPAPDAEVRPWAPADIYLFSTSPDQSDPPYVANISWSWLAGDRAQMLWFDTVRPDGSIGNSMGVPTSWTNFGMQTSAGVEWGDGAVHLRVTQFSAEGGWWQGRPQVISTRLGITWIPELLSDPQDGTVRSTQPVWFAPEPEQAPVEFPLLPFPSAFTAGALQPDLSGQDGRSNERRWVDGSHWTEARNVGLPKRVVGGSLYTVNAQTPLSVRFAWTPSSDGWNPQNVTVTRVAMDGHRDLGQTGPWVTGYIGLFINDQDQPNTFEWTGTNYLVWITVQDPNGGGWWDCGLYWFEESAWKWLPELLSDQQDGTWRSTQPRWYQPGGEVGEAIVWLTFADEAQQAPLWQEQPGQERSLYPVWYHPGHEPQMGTALQPWLYWVAAGPAAPSAGGSAVLIDDAGDVYLSLGGPLIVKAT